MAANSFKIKNSLNLEPIAGAAPTAEGDIVYDLTTHKLEVHNGTASSPLVTEASTATIAAATSGNAATATTATTATNATNAATVTKADNVNYYPTFVAANSSSNQAIDVGPMTYNPSTGVLTTTTFAGNASTATTATSATTATNIAGGSGGSIPYQSAANTTALLANGTAGKVLTSAGTTLAPTWETPTGGGVNTMGAIGSSPNANAATISGSTLNLEPASATYGGIVTTGTQTIAGAKTFTGSMAINRAADAVQLYVQGHSTQTSKIFEVYNSGFTSLASINNSGDLYTRGSTTQLSGATTTTGAVITQTANPSTVGVVRLSNTEGIGWRNAANTANLTAIVSSSDILNVTAPITSTGQVLGANLSKNYISNPKAEVDATGWTAYLDAAGTAPVDGTGGSPNADFTFARSTSSPLRDTASFLLTHTANDRQGTGWSTPFTIDTADQAKVLQFSFDFYVASGTYADGNMTVWIYDVTNSLLIQPAGYSISNAVGYQKVQGTFQTSSNSTSYRFILHNSTSTATAFTAQFDNFFLTPQVTTQGAAITDWVAYTPTGSWVSNTTYTGQWRRVGDSAEIRVKLALTGAPTNTGLTINLPSGLVMDTTKGLGTDSNHSLNAIAAGLVAGATFYNFTAYYNSTTSFGLFNIYVAGTTATTSQQGLSATLPGTWASGDFIYAQIKVPIVGWSSNVQLSSDTDTRVVAARIYKAANQTSVNPNGSAVKINFDTTSVDTHGAWASNKYTVQVPGVYSVGLSLSVAATNVLANDYYAVIYKNGAWVSGQYYRAVVGTAFQIANTDTFSCVAGDYFEAYLFGAGNNSASTLTVNGTTDDSFMTITRFSGPATIAASESVNGRYHASSTSLSGKTAISWTTKDFDSHSALSGTTLTIPVSGMYQFNFNVAVNMTSTATDSGALQMYITKNGTDYSRNYVDNAILQTVIGGGLSDIVRCLAGDTIVFNVYAAGTAPSINSTYTYVSWAKVGNY